MLKGLTLAGAMILLVVGETCPLSAQSEKQVREITIHSASGGLPTPNGSSERSTDIRIRRWGDKFLRDGSGEPVDPGLVQALVSAVEAPQIAKPEMKNLGITEAWLKEAVVSQKPFWSKAPFEAKFTNVNEVAKLVPELCNYISFDDNHQVQAEIEFDYGSKLAVSSSSYYVFMLPWQVDGQSGATFNADISRALSALLQRTDANKGKLAGADLAERLTTIVEFSMMRVE